MNTSLSITKRRNSLSAVVKIASHYYLLSKKIAKSQTNENWNVFSKTDSIERIEWFAEEFKKNLSDHLAPDEAVRISGKLNTIKTTLMTQLIEEEIKFKLFNEISRMFKQIFKQVLYENPAVIKQPNFVLSKEDFQVAQMPNYEEYSHNHRVSYCYDFAFYQLNEERAFPYIFHSKLGNWPEGFFTSTAKHLFSWGYKQKTKPRSGDLVVYSHKGEAKHFGVWTDDKNVLSKLGMTYVVKHPIDDVVLAYGDTASFFRKKIKSSLTKNYLMELDKAHESLSDFSDVTGNCSLSTLNYIEKITEILKKTEIVNTFEKSIYNTDYNNKLKQEILLRISVYTVSVLDSTDKFEALKALRKIVLSASQQIHKKI